MSRGSGAWMAKSGSATEGGIRSLGKWNPQVLAGCYLTSLPQSALRTMGGLSPEEDILTYKELQLILHKCYSVD